MRTTVSIPSRLYDDVQELKASRSFSDFAAEAIRRHVDELRRQQLGEQMAEGYRAEATNPSLDVEWTAIETEEF